MSLPDWITIGELAARSGVASSTLRFIIEWLPGRPLRSALATVDAKGSAAWPMGIRVVIEEGTWRRDGLLLLFR